jgi:hypothetical protein
MLRLRRPLGLSMAGAVLFGLAWLAAGGSSPQAGGEVVLAQMEPPDRHFRLERPASLSDADAIVIYDRIHDDMVAAYRLSEEPGARDYPRWTRYNSAPYRSATHGERFVNNYANTAGRAYGRFEQAGTLPVGTVLVKDSFTVTADGDVFTGPLFLMEKMPAGFNPEGRDWRYFMVLPDGSLFGTTGGEGHARMTFCQDCHAAAGDAVDHLFFLPERLRRRPVGTVRD